MGKGQLHLQWQEKLLALDLVCVMRDTGPVLLRPIPYSFLVYTTAQKENYSTCNYDGERSNVS